jgi:hypothetical protein
MFSPFGDNVLYEGIRAAEQEDTLIREYQQFPRNAIQITGGAQHNEALAFAARFKRETPTPRVYYRFGNDDNIHRYLEDGRAIERMTPEAAAAYLANIATSGVIPSYNNEPTKGTLTEVATHAIQTMRLLHARGVSNVVMLNWNTGFIENLEIQWPHELDELYLLIRQYGYTAGFHEYMNTRFSDSVDKPLYVGRYRYVLKRFEGLKVAITEFGFDSHAPNPALDGYKNHWAIWQQLFPGKSPAQVYFDEAVKADEAFYAVDGIEDILWFCRGHNLTSRWTSYNYQNEGELIQRKATYRRKIVTQINYGQRIERGLVSLVGASAVNVRSTPSTAQAAIGQLKGGELLPYYATPQAGWWQIEFAGRTAYVSAQYVQITASAIDPHPPVYLPDLEFDLDGRISRPNLAKFLRALADLIEFGVLESQAA